MTSRQRREAARRRRRRERIAIGLGAGVLVSLVVVWVAVAATGGKAPQPGPVNGPTPTSVAATEGGFAYEVTSARCGFDNVISSTDRIAAKGQFCQVEVTERNTSHTSQTIDLACQYLISDAHLRYVVHERATRVATGEDSAFDAGLAPGAELSVPFQFDIPDGLNAVAVELHSTCASPGVRLALPAT